MWNRGDALPQSKPDGFASSLGEGASGVPGALQYTRELSHYVKSPISEGVVAVGDWGSYGTHPLSLLTAFAASSPKGTPFSVAANFPATTKSRLLGQDGRGNFRFPTPKS